MNPNLRDRDAVITAEGIIFRVYGYTHPPEAYICDVEYAPSSIYVSTDPRALRDGGEEIYYKFYADGGLRFVRERFPKYVVFYEPLETDLVGVKREDIHRILKPEEKFEELIEGDAKDPLIKALKSVYEKVSSGTNLSVSDFGVFGSILHSFYNPEYSDIDLIIYGRENLEELKWRLKELYKREVFRNEFSDPKSVSGKNWRFKGYSLKEYVEHQRRKLIYALYRDEESRREIKIEFEPVKRWEEIRDYYDPKTRIRRVGWIRALARVTEDSDAPFMPSIYGVELLKVLEGREFDDIVRIVSYVEEFRMQANTHDLVYVEGNLEEVRSSKGCFHQITLTYCDRYYEQVLKVLG